MFYVDIHLVSDGGVGGEDETFLVPPQQLRARLGEDVHLPCPTRDTGQETLYLMHVDRCTIYRLSHVHCASIYKDRDEVTFLHNGCRYYAQCIHRLSNVHCASIYLQGYIAGCQ